MAEPVLETCTLVRALLEGEARSLRPAISVLRTSMADEVVARAGIERERDLLVARAAGIRSVIPFAFLADRLTAGLTRQMLESTETLVRIDESVRSCSLKLDDHREFIARAGRLHRLLDPAAVKVPEISRSVALRFRGLAARARATGRERSSSSDVLSLASEVLDLIRRAPVLVENERLEMAATRITGSAVSLTVRNPGILRRSGRIYLPIPHTLWHEARKKGPVWTRTRPVAAAPSTSRTA